MVHKVQISQGEYEETFLLQIYLNGDSSNNEWKTFHITSNEYEYDEYILQNETSFPAQFGMKFPNSRIQKLVLDDQTAYYVFATSKETEYPFTEIEELHVEVLFEDDSSDSVKNLIR